MKFSEFMERGGAMLDRMAAVRMADMRRAREPGDHDLSDEEITAHVQWGREQLRKQIINLLRSHGAQVHHDFAATPPANDNLATMPPMGAA